MAADTSPTVEAIELRILRLALVRPFATAHGTTAARDVLVVHVVGDGVEGWGECAADTVATYWRETVASAWADLVASAGRAPEQPMARAALEMALLDQRLRAAGTSMRDHVGGTRTSIDVTVTAGFEDDVDELLAPGYRSLKLKVAPTSRPPEPRHGVAIQVDANASLDPHVDRVLLSELDRVGLVLIEQPFAAHELAEHAALGRVLRTPICLDESIGSDADALAAFEAAACRVVCVKPSRLGGFGEAMRVHDRCVAAGVEAKVGGMLETGIGRAAALALAALPGFTLPADLSASERYWRDEVITEPFTLDGHGRLAVPSGPGLGVEVRRDVIDAATIERTTIPLERPGTSSRAQRSPGT
ncbi:MAG: enolase C-terminal domain-like protein [Acidimicrobiales bacterium]